MKTNRVFSIDDLKNDGDFTFSGIGKTYFIQKCPIGSCQVEVHLEPPDEANRIWQWDGNIDEPTITPSIGCDIAPRCGRHCQFIKGIRHE